EHERLAVARAAARVHVQTRSRTREDLGVVGAGDGLGRFLLGSRLELARERGGGGGGLQRGGGDLGCLVRRGDALEERRIDAHWISLRIGHPSTELERILRRPRRAARNGAVDRCHERDRYAS